MFGIFDGALSYALSKLGAKPQGEEVSQRHRDVRRKGADFSIEAQVCEALTDLMREGFEWRFTGASERARLFDAEARAFVREDLRKAVSLGMEFGDAVVVPSWDGARFDHFALGADEYRIISAAGGEITDLIYRADAKKVQGSVYTLVQRMRLVPYTAADGSRASRAEMRAFVVSNGGALVDMARFPDWRAKYDDEWSIPNVRALPIGRWRSFAIDPANPNSTYGAPICFGAGGPIREIHYLTEQRHTEFALSEKSIIADKTMFVTRDDKGGIRLPRGMERVFMKVNNGRSLEGTPLMKEWAPTIQNSPYDSTLEAARREVEAAVGVDSGIISKPDDPSYQNVDNVRKSMRKTKSFIGSARNATETMLSQLADAWEVLANYYGVPTGDYEVTYDWSDDYINTFADTRDAIIGGYSLGATDALDYRLAIMGEPVEVARQRVEEIGAARSSSVTAFEV